ncbi:MAG: PQQ-dependent sugar dehydrogenase, partial [Acidimicrobiia bacterium]
MTPISTGLCNGIRARFRRCYATGSWPVGVLSATLLPLVFAISPLTAATLPPGFTEELVASGMTDVTAMAFTPDGRLLVCQQRGALRVIKQGVLLPTPFMTVPVHSTFEWGLLGVAVDPDFVKNQYIYVYYTAASPTTHHRV